jgi:hypothetical protein
MLRSMPPVIATSQWCSMRASTAASRAAKLEAQAASVTKLGPRRFSTLATRPDRMLASSPGIVSSVTGGRAWFILSCQRDRMRWRTSAGRSRNSCASFSHRAHSGNWMRSVVR